MSDFSISEQIGDRKYSVSLKIKPLSHLCTFREISDFKLTITDHNKRFDTFNSFKGTLTEDEINFVTSMFSKVISESRESYEAIGFLLSINTGNAFKWEYTKDQKKAFMPIINSLQEYSKMVLYTSTDSIGYYDDDCADEDEAYRELTMYNFSKDTLVENKNNFSRFKNILVDKLPPEEVPQQQELQLTEQMIRDYLNQGS